MQPTAEKSQGPLAGLRVIDIATIIAAPSAGALLADYGADVLKIELPGKGDGARDFPPFKAGKSLWWKVINRNKSFLTLDLRKPEGAELLKQLVFSTDVLIENFRPKTLERWGLSREVLWSINPRLVILRVTGFGQDGPYSERPGFARSFEAMGGLTYLTGETEGEPMHPGYPLGDAVGGLFGAIGVLAALAGRVMEPDRLGEEIDLSLTEATLKLLEFLAVEYDQTGVVRGRTGNANQYSAPAAVFKTSDDRWVTLSGSTNSLFKCNCLAIGRPDLIENPAYGTNSTRLKHSSELNSVFAKWIGSHPLNQVLDAFQRAGGTIAPIYSIDEIFHDPQMSAREAIVPVADDDFGTVKIQNVVPRFSQYPAAHRWTAGSLGRDSNEILIARLGLSKSKIEVLRSKGVI